MIERITGQGYEEFMMSLLKNVEISDMKIGRTQKRDLDANEVIHAYECQELFLLFPSKSRKQFTRKYKIYLT